MQASIIHVFLGITINILDEIGFFFREVDQNNTTRIELVGYETIAQLRPRGLTELQVKRQKWSVYKHKDKIAPTNTVFSSFEITHSQKSYERIAQITQMLSDLDSTTLNAEFC